MENENNKENEENKDFDANIKGGNLNATNIEQKVPRALSHNHLQNVSSSFRFFRLFADSSVHSTTVWMASEYG